MNRFELEVIREIGWSVSAASAFLYWEKFTKVMIAKGDNDTRAVKKTEYNHSRR